MADNNNEESIRREQDARDSATKSTKQLTDVLDDLIERNKSADDKLKKLNKELDTGRKRFVDIGPALESLRESIEEVADVDKKAALTKELERKESQAKSAQYNRLIVDSAAALASGLASAGVNISKSVINSYQSNASAFQTAGDVLSAGFDASNQTVKGFAAAANTAGAGLMFLGPKGIAAGLALQGIATVATFLSEKFNDLAKFGINVAVKELENTTKNFAAASAAGALFSQGMGEMRKTARDAGLTQEQYAKVITENAGTFAMFGGTVGAGAQQFLRINKEMKGYQTGLIKLGYSIEEIADGTAQYMAIQAASGQGNRRDYANLAKETDAYLTNLRVISAFTGEDAKKKMEQARNASMQLAIDTRIRNMEASGDKQARERFMGTIGILPEKMQKAAMQIAEVGSITDPDLAAAFYNNKEAMMVLNDAATLFKTSNLSAADATQKMIATQKVASQTAFDSNKDFNKAVGTSTLAINANAGVTSAAEEANRYLLKKQTDDAKTATETAKDQKTTNDTLSNATADATVQMQGLRITIQDKLEPAITKFAKFIPEIIKGINETLRAAGIFLTTPGGGGPKAGTPAAPFQSPAKSNFEKNRERFNQRKAGGTEAPAPETAPAGGEADKTVSATGLKLKPGAEDKGKSANTVYTVAEEVAKMLNGDYKYFSGFRDRDGNSAHASGRAFDLVLNDPSKYESTLAQIKSIEQVKFAQFEKKGQRNPNGSVATGDHIHAEVQAAQGAVVPATTGGVNVKVAEGGASEVIAPLKNGRLPGMDEMIERLDQMISVMKDQRDTSEKIFNATA
jgi:hypothetical protein